MSSTRNMLRYWQRWVGVSVLALFVTYLVNSLYNTPVDKWYGNLPKSSSSSTSSPPQQPASPPSPIYTPKPAVDDGRFHWGDLKSNYPIKNFTTLVTSSSNTVPRVQHSFTKQTPGSSFETKRLRRQKAVKDAFSRCWTSYVKHAWLADELAPMSGTARNPFGGWAATLVDSLDTLLIMDMKDEFHEAIRSLDEIDFSRSSLDNVNVFETTIRYLGGFLAAYDLSGEISLLHKAVEIGDMLYVAFDTPNHLPVTRWDFAAAMKGKPQEAPEWMLSAELGSFTLEFTRLTQLTGNPKWFDAADRITRLLVDTQMKTKLPGIWGVAVDAKTPDMTKDSSFSLGAMADSLYEYFPKSHALLAGADPSYRTLYNAAISTATQHLFFRPMTPDSADILISGIYHTDRPASEKLEHQGQHLVCYAGGMLAIGSRVFSEPSHLDLATKLVDGCIWAYRAYPSGMMPEVFHMLPCSSSSSSSSSCPWDESAWLRGVLKENGVDQSDTDAARQLVQDLRLQPGFTKLDDRRYILRPEAIESVFVLYRVTGREDLLDAAWDMFDAIQKATETELANAALGDMSLGNARESQSDSMESFWMAETLKYFYLIFSEPDLVSLDDFVFNTEAHPLRTPS